MSKPRSPKASVVDPPTSKFSAESKKDTPTSNNNNNNTPSKAVTPAPSSSSSSPATKPKPQPKQLQIKTSSTPPARQPKKIQRGSSKPIINWLQRKLGGSQRGKRTERPSLTPAASRPGSVNRRTSHRTNGTGVGGSPLPSPGLAPSTTKRSVQRRAISLNNNGLDDEGVSRRSSSFSDEDDDSESAWAPSTAAEAEADEDASVRPLPPSSPPSPSPSRSSSSYMSNPRTFRSMAASTKPTTLLSVDIGLQGNQVAHIAQAHTPTSAARLHARSPSLATNGNNNGNGNGSSNVVGSSGASITFSALPPSPHSSRPASVNEQPSSGNAVQAPLHTAHHPRNNPRPASPPQDNASLLTLASSAYNTPGLRHGAGWSSIAQSVLSPSDSLSHFGGDGASAYQYGYGGREDERDVDASVRALRPRSSRGSWESEASGWSARDEREGGASLMTRECSEGAAESLRTGVEDTETEAEAEAESESAVKVPGAGEATTPPAVVERSEADVSLDTIASPELEMQPSTMTVRPQEAARITQALAAEAKEPAAVVV